MLELSFPEYWEVKEYRMEGHDAPAMSSLEMWSALENPMGTERISELARGMKEVAIIFDDMTRGTRVYEIVPYILDELRKGGITNSHIRFVMALGVHGARTRIDFALKLGEDVVSKFAVYNHNAFYNLVDLGKTSSGTPVELNAEVERCDLKIGVGSIVPHPMTGFGGGSKIILPGVVSIDAIHHNHVIVGGCGPNRTPHPSLGRGVGIDNAIFRDMEEATVIAGLDVKVDALLNCNSESTELFVGDPLKEFRVGVDAAKDHCATDPVKDAEIVVVNAPSKSNESRLALWPGTRYIKEGGTVVLISNIPEGQVTHYLYGKFGEHQGGKGWTPQGSDHPYDRLIVYSKYVEVDPHLEIASKKDTVWMKGWDEVIAELEKKHGKDAKVAIYPCSEIQYPPGGIPYSR
jgi:nickel-dependent lactate racemase